MTMWKRKRVGTAGALAGMLLACAGLAHAELGGDAASVRNEAQRIQANLKVTPFDAYDVHELAAPRGLTVRQYLDRNGKVFGVAWQASGPVDLGALLGNYYAAYRAQGVQRVDLHHAALHSPGLVVEVGGALHAFSGRAFVPGALPAGVSPNRIQ